MKTVSIVIPVFNEEATINELLTRVRDVKLQGLRKEVILVDDGSTDRTRQHLKKWKKYFQVIYKPKNQGKGSAVRTALQKISGDIIVIQDADLEYNPQDYPNLLEPFTDNRVFVVYGSRFLGPHLSTMYLYSLGNKFVTWISNILYNTTITDMETGYKVFRREVLAEVSLSADRFDFEPEFTAKILRAGYQIYEVPISYFGRKFSEGKKLTWRDGVKAVWTLVKYRFTI